MGRVLPPVPRRGVVRRSFDRFLHSVENGRWGFYAVVAVTIVITWVVGDAVR